MRAVIDILWSFGYLARRELWRRRGEEAYYAAVTRETRRWMAQQ